MTRPRRSAASRIASAAGARTERAPRKRVPRRHWPSEAEQTVQALRAGTVDALIVEKGPGTHVYALKTFEELESANIELRTTRDQLVTLLNEREELMQDLHDGCIQSIYSVGLMLEDCRGLTAQDPAQAAQKIAQAQAALNIVIDELRIFISGQPVDTSIDLGVEVAAIVERLGTRSTRFKVEIDANVARTLPYKQAVELVQIAREALSNVVRHAKAKSARISLQRRGKRVRLEVVDDGQGFDASTATPGLGLHHIEARVKKLGGRLQIDSKRARGCRIVIDVG